MRRRSCRTFAPLNGPALSRSGPAWCRRLLRVSVTAAYRRGASSELRGGQRGRTSCSLCPPLLCWPWVTTQGPAVPLLLTRCLPSCPLSLSFTSLLSAVLHHRRRRCTFSVDLSRPFSSSPVSFFPSLPSRHQPQSSPTACHSSNSSETPPSSPRCRRRNVRSWTAWRPV